MESYESKKEVTFVDGRNMNSYSVGLGRQSLITLTLLWVDNGFQSDINRRIQMLVNKIEKKKNVGRREGTRAITQLLTSPFQD